MTRIVRFAESFLKMKITINDEPAQFETPPSVADLLKKTNRNADGLAVAVNKKIIPRAEHATCLLRDADEVLIFCAIAGG